MPKSPFAYLSHSALELTEPSESLVAAGHFTLAPQETLRDFDEVERKLKESLG